MTVFYAKARLPIAIVAGIMCFSPALAQPLPGSQAARTIEEITVSARRTEESIQSVPVSVSAFDNAALREASISNPEDLQLSTPGVFLSGTGGRQNVVYQIRGQSKTTFGPSSPAVVSYFAEVPDPFMGSFVPQYDMASVQVLKGPQGTLFGRNTTGGAILYSPVAPSHEFEGYVSAGIGNYDSRKVQGAVNLPLADGRVALRLTTSINEREGFTRNIGAGGELDDIDDQSYRASLLLEPVDGFSNTTIFEYYKSDSGGSASILSDVASGQTLLASLGLQASAFDALAQQKQWGPYKTRSFQSPDDEKNERTSVTNRTEIDFGAIQLVNIFGYRDTALFLNTNTDGMFTLTADGTGPYPAGTPVNYIKANLTNETEQFSNELQLRGKLFDDRLDWLVGAFWLKSEPGGPQGSQVVFGHVPGTPPPPAAYIFITEESKAVFTHLSYDLSSLVDGLQLELGLRYTEDDIEGCVGTGVTGSSKDVELGDCEAGRDNTVNTSINKTSSEETTWSVGLNWQVTPDLFTYVVSRRGYRAGGVNGPTFSGRLAPLQSFEPETVTDVELGLRTDWTLGDVAVRSNLSAFLGKYQKVQSGLTGVQTALAFCNPAIDNPPGVSPDGDCDLGNDPSGGVMLVNLGESEVSGADFELVVAPSESLSLNFAANYLDMKTKKFEVPPALDPYIADRGIPFTYAAQKTVIAGLRYAMHLAGIADELVFNADYYWTDDVRFTDFDTPSYKLTNLRLDLNSVAGSNLDLSFHVRNLFDREYVSGVAAGGAFVGMTSVVYGPPRMYGAELRYRFGAP